MEIIFSVGLFIIFLFFISNQTQKKESIRDQLDREKWQDELKLGTTELSLKDWKIAEARLASNARVEHEKILFDEMLKRGIELQNVKRKGTLRNLGKWDYFGNLSDPNGIHPKEAELYEREKKALKLLNRGRSGPRGFGISKRLIVANSGEVALTKEEEELVRQELRQIDYEWSALNIHFLDEYYDEHIKGLTREDFSLIFNPPQNTSQFPCSAGQWTAKSKRWGFRAKGGELKAIWASAYSKNHAIVLALENIESRRMSKNDLVPVPFDPMDADL
jgi:hypothetical protein